MSTHHSLKSSAHANKPIQIVAMRTWGELGNLLAAQTLAQCLRQHGGLDVQVVEAESFVPRFADVGAQIREIMHGEHAAEVRRTRYMLLVHELEALFTPGFERRASLPPLLRTEAKKLVEYLADVKPALVIGTKGIISRLSLAALRASGLHTPVLNFVTNEGLLHLPIHRSTAVHRHLVPFESARQYLIQRHSYDPAQVRAVGRLVAHVGASEFIESSDDQQAPADLPLLPRRVVVFSNRGGSAYLEILEAIARHEQPVALLFIALNDPALVSAASALAERQGCSSWRIVDKLPQGEYLRCLKWVSQAPLPLLITKTGPNTCLEAAYFGLPQLLLDSGLPMEQWVGPFVEEHGFGRAFASAGDLVCELESWLEDGQTIASHRERARAFASHSLDQAQVSRDICDNVRQVLQENFDAQPSAAAI